MGPRVVVGAKGSRVVVGRFGSLVVVVVCGGVHHGLCNQDIRINFIVFLAMGFMFIMIL